MPVKRSIPLSVFRKKGRESLTISESMVVFLLEDAGMSISEVAAELGRSYYTVRTQYIRALRKLGRFKYLKKRQDGSPILGVFCTSACPQRGVCAVERVPLLVHAVVINRRMKKISEDSYINEIVNLKKEDAKQC